MHNQLLLQSYNTSTHTPNTYCLVVSRVGSTGDVASDFSFCADEYELIIKIQIPQMPQMLIRQFPDHIFPSKESHNQPPPH